ncbi:MAG: N-acetylmuramoyl-L-alanine amidase, partial [Alphaproteobacteria bacterium]
MIDHPSPNHGERGPGAVVNMLLLHYTGMTSCEAALDRLCDPGAKVSAHYLVDEDGAVFRLVAEPRRAWHAGVSYWRGEQDLNSCSLGIELVNPGHEFGYRPFPEPQMAALERLALDLVRRHRIPPSRVLGHSDVAPRRRRDPGELFDWPRLARPGVGLWPEWGPTPVGGQTLGRGDEGPEVLELQRALAAFGYETSAGGRFDDET